jgi:hypothetical protein
VEQQTPGGEQPDHTSGATQLFCHCCPYKGFAAEFDSGL